MKRLILITFTSIAIESADAQPLIDPMRPPAAMLSTPTGTRTAATLANAAPARPIVQTIIIGPDRRYAVVDGRAVAPGDQVRGMRVVRIAESGVTLRDSTGNHLEVDLLPGAGKRFSTSAAQPERPTTPVRDHKQ